MTANLIKSQAISLIALAAKSLGVLPTPSPSGGDTAPSFVYSPRTLIAWPYSSRLCCLSQFVLPANCWTCTASFRGANSLMA
eukprot:7943187-Alexandrium_andersonii.AAC.1